MKFKSLLIAFVLIAFSGYTAVAQNSDEKMQQILQEKRVKNLNSKVKGFRIQLYYGMSEQKAQEIRNTFSGLYPDVATRLFYKQPEWKVHIGNFQTKLEAEKMLAKLREDFGNAFILQTEISL